jgi:uncharacterized membrane protein YkvA (DUF1232 family)
MFFRKAHKLPRFPEEAAHTFKALCGHISSQEVQALSIQLDEMYNSILEKVSSSPNMNLDRFRDVYAVARYLMNHFESFAKDQQYLIIGGVRYFTMEHDSVSDIEFYTGFDDDAKVLNYVLEQIGVHDRYISLQGSLW